MKNNYQKFQCGDLTETFLKPFKTLVSRVLSHIKHSASHCVFTSDKTLLLVF